MSYEGPTLLNQSSRDSLGVKASSRNQYTAAASGSEACSKDKIKKLEQEFKRKFIESLHEQLDKKMEYLKNQCTVVQK